MRVSLINSRIFWINISCSKVSFSSDSCGHWNISGIIVFIVGAQLIFLKVSLSNFALSSISIFKSFLKKFYKKKKSKLKTNPYIEFDLKNSWTRGSAVAIVGSSIHGRE